MNKNCCAQILLDTLSSIAPLHGSCARSTKVIVIVLVCLSQLPALSATESHGRWCQKSVKEEKTREVVERKKCIQKYVTRCGFFSLDSCTFYKTTTCLKRYDQNITIYHTVLDCCPGWAKSDSETCFELAQGSKPLPSIHELSIGTLAAICSASFFIMIILFFIVKAVWKKKRKEKAAAAASASICLEPLQLVSSNSPQDHQDPTNMNSVHFQPLVIALPSPPLPSPEVPSFSPAAKTANPHNLPSSPEICELSVEDSERVPLKQTQLEMQPLTEIETLEAEMQPTEPQVEEQELAEELVDNKNPQASESLHSAESDTPWQLQDVGKESEKCEQTKESEK
ncbi:uncharacterized protein LOC106869812 isoform X2 [Octopus bimaculoides]|uniref:uncharacterized protein LOC106869812 isoform X2 n=1 Tax=Octopus bimaculoides TaxID=37653 RepID=UPI00071D3CB2|nr:uncharacterized protein LOC106869812 isoform X2 [Octopus bimaculoides]|eukprot:XP_014771182.1 PREDICTED: uncharacterized protein LOC106869812 isoform X2 [Octopus bimaculoides]